MVPFIYIKILTHMAKATMTTALDDTDNKSWGTFLLNFKLKSVQVVKPRDRQPLVGCATATGIP